MSAPFQANATWFAALKGRAARVSVHAAADFMPGAHGRLILPVGWNPQDFPDAPEGMKAGDVCWFASCPAVEGLYGVGLTPADAIERFNIAMVTP